MFSGQFKCLSSCHLLGRSYYSIPRGGLRGGGGGGGVERAVRACQKGQTIIAPA